MRKALGCDIPVIVYTGGRGNRSKGKRKSQTIDSPGSKKAEKTGGAGIMPETGET